MPHNVWERTGCVRGNRSCDLELMQREIKRWLLDHVEMGLKHVDPDIASNDPAFLWNPCVFIKDIEAAADEISKTIYVTSPARGSFDD